MQVLRDDKGNEESVFQQLNSLWYHEEVTSGAKLILTH